MFKKQQVELIYVNTINTKEVNKTHNLINQVVGILFFEKKITAKAENFPHLKF